MAKKNKGSRKGWRRYMPVILLGTGAALVIFGRQFFDNATDNFINGINYQFHGLKLKFANVTTLRVTAILTITNTNSFGGKVNRFNGSLKYGRTGPQIVPINVGQFNLPAGGSADAQVISEVGLLQLGGNLVEVVRSVIKGDLKKLWLSGTLDTTFALIPVDTEITPFEA